MYKKYSLYILSLVLIVLSIGFFKPVSVLGETYSSTNFNVFHPVINTGAGTSSSSSFGVGQSIGQSVIGKSSSSNFQVWSGFQYYSGGALTFTLLGTSSTTETGAVVLVWSPPVTSSPIIGYDVGVGTIPFSYTYQDVGNVTSFTKNGLTNGVTYYFIVKAKTTGGVPLAYSNQISVIPTGTTSSGSGGGSSGGGGYAVSGGNVEISGMAYPNTKVTLLKDGAVISTTIADPGAVFHMNVSSLPAGYYNFGVYAEDTKDFKSPTYNFPVTVSNAITVYIDNVFLAPTIGVSNTEVKQGDPIGIFGTTIPNAEVTLHVHSAKDFIQKIIAKSTGLWFKQFDTSLLEVGDHITFSRASLDDHITDQSNTVGFKVGDVTVETPKDKRSDLNNDGRVNLSDFSILLYFWKKTSPLNPKADINKDGVVDNIDFSIMLYDWTG